MEEIWKDIKGYSGYQVSNLGRVRTHIIYKKKERISLKNESVFREYRLE